MNSEIMLPPSDVVSTPRGGMMIHRFLLVAFLVVLSPPVPPLLAASQEMARPLTFAGPRLQVEDLTADFHSDGKVLVVSGKIKNLGFAKTRGYVTVYFKDMDHHVLRTVDVKINDNQCILTGQAVPFETTTNIDGIRGLANVSVEFVEKSQGSY